jgi:hypothetical protein
VLCNGGCPGCISRGAIAGYVFKAGWRSDCLTFWLLWGYCFLIIDVWTEVTHCWHSLVTRRFASHLVHGLSPWTCGFVSGPYPGSPKPVAVPWKISMMMMMMLLWSLSLLLLSRCLVLLFSMLGLSLVVSCLLFADCLMCSLLCVVCCFCLLVLAYYLCWSMLLVSCLGSP